jgi:hypothetical protein
MPVSKISRTTKFWKRDELVIRCAISANVGPPFQADVRGEPVGPAARHYPAEPLAVQPCGSEAQATE